MGFLHARYWSLGYDLEGCKKDQVGTWLFLDAYLRLWYLHSVWGQEIGKLNGKN